MNRKEIKIVFYIIVALFLAWAIFPRVLQHTKTSTPQEIPDIKTITAEGQASSIITITGPFETVPYDEIIGSRENQKDVEDEKSTKYISDRFLLSEDFFSKVVQATRYRILDEHGWRFVHDDIEAIKAGVPENERQVGNHYLITEDYFSTLPLEDQSIISGEKIGKISKHNLDLNIIQQEEKYFWTSFQNQELQKEEKTIDHKNLGNITYSVFKADDDQGMIVIRHDLNDQDPEFVCTDVGDAMPGPNYAEYEINDMKDIVVRYGNTNPKPYPSPHNRCYRDNRIKSAN